MLRNRVGIAIFGWVLVAGSAGKVRAETWADPLFSELGHDFGPVARGATVRHPFVLTNRTAEPIAIVNLRASCGCTTGKAGTSTLGPGQGTAIEAEMDTRNFSGKKATTLFVTLATSSGREAEVRLAVTADILSDIVLNPGTIDLGAVPKGQAARKSLTIERIGGADWRVERMLSACRSIDANMVETARSAAGVTYTLTVALKPDAPAGTIRDEIRVLTNDPESPTIPVQVTAQVRGELTATPGVLSLGKVGPAAGTQGRYLIRGSHPFAIAGIEGLGDGFHLEAVDGTTPKTVHLLTLTYRPEESNARGDVRRGFRVVTNLPGEPPVDLLATLHVEP